MALCGDQLVHFHDLHGIVAELHPHIDLPVHALAGHRGVQLVGPPFHVEVYGRARIHGALQPALADEAPGAHGVGDHIYLHGA
jgi:hypothetical protein